MTLRPRVLAIAATAALGAVVATHAHAMAATVTVLGRAHLGWVLALLGLAIAGPLLHSELLRSGQATVGARFGRWEATRLAAGIHAANLVVRAEGIAGLGVLLAHPGERSIAGSARSAAYLLGREVAHVSVAAIALAAVALLGVDDRLSPIVVVGAVLFFISRFVHAGLLVLAAVRPQWLPRWRRLDRVREHAPAFAIALRGAAARPARLLRIAAWALALDLLHIGWLWVALRAVGAPTSIDATFETYGIVALLATVSVLPAGLGAVDAGLVAALHHSGVGLAAAGAGVLLYRVAELWVPLLAGARPALAAAARQRVERRRSAPGPMPAAVVAR